MEFWGLLENSRLLIWEQSLQDRFVEKTFYFNILYNLQAVGGIFASGTNVVVLAMGASATDAAFFCFVIRCCFKLAVAYST